MDRDSRVIALRVYRREHLELAKQEIAKKALSEVSDILFDNNHEWVSLRLNIVEPEEWEWEWFDSNPTGSIMPFVRGKIDVYIPQKVPYTMVHYNNEDPLAVPLGGKYGKYKDKTYAAFDAITKALLSGARAFLYNFTYESVQNDIDRFCGR